MKNLVLSLFPGIGLFDKAFEDLGFCVVRGPDLIWGGDIKKFHPPAGVFDGIIGGPPCQAHSVLVHIIKANGYKVAEDLIPEFERIISEVSPKWWVMEMVPRGPTPEGTQGSLLVRDADCGGLTSRLRRFSWAGLNLTLPDVTKKLATHRAVTRDAREVPIKIGGSGKVKKGLGGALPHSGKSLSVPEMLLRRQGFAENLLDKSPFTAQGKKDAIGNGVPYSMGRAIASAVKRQLE